MTKILPTVGRVVWFTPSRFTGDSKFRGLEKNARALEASSPPFHRQPRRGTAPPKLSERAIGNAEKAIERAIQKQRFKQDLDEEDQ